MFAGRDNGRRRRTLPDDTQDFSHPPFGWSRAAAAGLTFRPITDADLPFLARLYASTRMEELSVTDWSDAQKAAFRRAVNKAHAQVYSTDESPVEPLLSFFTRSLAR